MEIGFGAPVSGAWATPQNLAMFAKQAEQAGYRCLWSFQRLLIPVGSPIERTYYSVLDPVVALSYAAAVTSTIRLGIAVINLPFESPALVAKRAASLDVLSGGRFELGLGLGWMPEEFALTGASTARRGARTVEYVRVLRALWADGEAEHEGEFFRIPAGSMAPKPVQPGGPPILLGGYAPTALRRAGRIADGWVSSSRADLSQISRSVQTVRAAATASGRDPDQLRIICRGVVRAGAEAFGPDGERLLLSGSYQQIREDTERLAAHGVTEVFYDLNWDPQVATPEADPVGATTRAEKILAALAPGMPAPAAGPLREEVAQQVDGVERVRQHLARLPALAATSGPL